MRLTERLQDPLVDALVGFTFLAAIAGLVLFGERLGWPDHVLGLILGTLFLLLLVAVVLGWSGARRRARAWDARMRRLGFQPIPRSGRFHAFARFRAYEQERADGTAVAVLLLPDERDRLAIAARTPWGEVYEDEVAPTDDLGLLRHVELLAERAARAVPGDVVLAEEEPAPPEGFSRLDVAKGIVGLIGLLAFVAYWGSKLFGLVDESFTERYFPQLMGLGLALAGTWVLLLWLERRRETSES